MLSDFIYSQAFYLTQFEMMFNISENIFSELSIRIY